MASITLNNVGKIYAGGARAVGGVNIDIADGEFLVLVGPSGCGKSTLLRMVAGLESISEGEVRIGDRVVNEVEPADRDIAMVFQNYALYPHMSVRQNLAYGLKNRGTPKAEIERRVGIASDILQIGPFLDRKPRALSGGQRQRVAMGRAIVREPAVFLFDEPLSNLDAKLRVQMRIELKKLHKKLNATSILVTHDQVEAMTMADKLIVMNKGHVEQVGSPAEVYRRPASIFVAAFTGAPAMNLAAGTVGDKGTVALDAAPTMPFASGAALGAGQRVTVGVRPEEIVLSASGKGLPGRIELIEELGGSRIAYCSVGSQEFATVMPPALDLSEGDEAVLDLPARALHFFDIESGRRYDA